MADEWKGASFKQIEDHSEAATLLLGRINATTIPVLLRGTSKSLTEYVDEVLALEKTARLSGDVLSTQRLAVEAIRIYRVQGETEKMIELVDSLMKRRAQTKQVQSAMVAEAELALSNESEDGALSSDARFQLLTKLSVVTEGRIHVELQHARFVVQLADIAEAEGRKREGADMLYTLQVETITNMPRLEKLSCLCRQIGLCLDLGDYLKTPMISRKINHRALNRPDTIDIKLRYFEMMRRYYAHKGQHLLEARCWYETFLATPSDDERLTALSNMTVLTLISEHQPAKEVEDAAECTAFAPQTMLADRAAALQVLLDNKRLDNELSMLYQITKSFTGVELIRVKIAPEIETLCNNHPMLAAFADRQEHFRNRTSEHDLLVVAKYYTRIRLNRLSKLVGLTAEHAERFVMSLVANKSVYAKMDRLEGLIVFQPQKKCTDVVSEWNDAVENCMDLIDRAAHLVVKERMLHNLPVGAATAAVGGTAVAASS